jgi:hypothetical protein
MLFAEKSRFFLLTVVLRRQCAYASCTGELLSDRADARGRGNGRDGGAEGWGRDVARVLEVPAGMPCAVDSPIRSYLYTITM